MRLPPWRRVALVLGGVLLGTVLLEGAARAHGAWFGAPGPGEFLVRDARLGWRNDRAFVGRHRTAAFDVEVCTDAAGLRIVRKTAAEAAIEPAEVWAIGDSTTFGWGVAAEQAYPARLAALAGVRVANLGVTGYAPDQQWLLLDDRLATPAANALRAVVVMHTANDVGEALRRRPYDRSKPLFELRDAEAVAIRGELADDWFAEHCRLWRIVRKRLPQEDLADLPEPERSRGRELVMALYERMHARCAQAGVEFVLASHHADWLVRAAAQRGVPHVDLTEAFDALAALGPIRFDGDPHWLPIVHQAVAERLAERLAGRLGDRGVSTPR